MSTTHRWRALLVVVAALGLAAGCSADSDSVAPSSGDRAPEAAAAPDAAGGEAAVAGDQAKADTGYDTDTAAAPAPVAERSLIYTGSITLKVDDVVAGANRAADIATGMSGVVAGDQRTLNDAYSTATLTLRVPEARFSDALNQLAGIGEEEARQVDATDVTDQLVDLDARIATQEASVTRVRALLAQATTIGEIVTIESELTRREADLDSLKQRRERLSGLVSLSTITVYLHGPAVDVQLQEDNAFVHAVKAGWHGFLVSVTVVLAILGFLVPVALVVGLPLWLLLWLLGRRRRRGPADHV